MKKDYKAQIALGVVFMILAFLVTIQFRSVTKNNAANLGNNQRIEDLLIELNKEREKTEALEQQIVEYEESISQYRNAEETSGGDSKFLSEQLKRAEILAGLTDVEGPGIEISLNDAANRKGAKGSEANSTLIHDEDIRRVINELSAAGAEAICVNDSRIISTSAVRCVGPTVLVNDTKMAPPYVIKAIGKPDQLEAALNLNGGVIDGLKVWGFEIAITKSDKLSIPKYGGTLNFRSATAVSTSENSTASGKEAHK